MPLLLIDPEPGPPPSEAEVTVPADDAVVVEVRRGQLLAIEAPVGGQVGSLFSWTRADVGEWLSPHHTRVFGGTFVLRLGTRLVTNRRRPIFVVGRDSARRHDLLLPAAVECSATVERRVTEAGFEIPRVPDPVNVFLDSRLGEDGRIELLPCPARAGERWMVRALIDSVVAVAAMPTGIPEASADPARPLRVIVRNEVRAVPVDLPVLAQKGG